MRILLVNPPIPLSYYNREFYLPSGLLYLASILKKNGEDVRILDLKPLHVEAEGTNDPQNFYENVLIGAISDFRPDMIGLGCLYSGNFPDLLKYAEVTKKRFEKIPIVIGGIHPTIYPDKILAKCPSIDWIILGEGEESILQLVNAIKDGRYEFDRIDGFAFRKSGRVVVNPKTSFINNLDSIPFPAYELVDLKDYYVNTSDWHNPKNLPINTSVPIITSRSCPNRCTFCSMYMVMGPCWRSRTPNNVVDEIEYVYRKYNHRHFSFMDDNLTLNRGHVLEICNQIMKRGLDIQFETPNGLGIGTLDEEILDAMVSAGLVRIYLAIESGSDFIRNKIMKKKVRRERIFEVVRLTKRYKHLYVKAFFIIGMPEETKETLMKTYEMIREIDVDRVYLHNIVPFPGTKVFEQAMRDNLLVEIDPENLYKSDELYITNYERIFIKPYNLELKDLLDFRAKCEKLIDVQRSKRAEAHYVLE